MLRCRSAILIPFALAACTMPDQVAPDQLTPHPFQTAMRLRPSDLPAAPNLDAARADEAAVLREIEQHLQPEDHDVIMSALRGTGAGRTAMFVEGRTPEWIDRYSRYYAALTHRVAEESRSASIAAARRRGPAHVAIVVAASAAPTTVLRRQSEFPANVIVLGADATINTLGAGLATLERSRESFGDDLVHDIVIEIDPAHSATLDPAVLARYSDVFRDLQSAPLRAIAGVGTVRAIDVSSPSRARPDR